MTLVLLLIRQGRTSGGHGLLEAVPRIYQVTPDIPDRQRATQQKEVRPNRPTASKRVSSPPGRHLLLGIGRHRPPNPNSKPRSGSPRRGAIRVAALPRFARSACGSCERRLVHHPTPLGGVPTTASRAEATVVSVSFDA